MMRELADFQLSKKEKEDSEEGWKLGERPDYSEKALKKQTDDLTLRSYVHLALIERLI
jgi:hypothetical protein